MKTYKNTNFCLLLIKGCLFCFIVLFSLSCKEAPTDVADLVSGVSGSVTSKSSGNPVIGSSITTIPSSKSTTTDNNGYYELKEITPGTYTVTATKSGFNSATVSIIIEEGKISRGDIQMLEEGPGISIQPSVIDFGTSQSTATVTISNTGVGSLDFNITKNASWLNITPVSGSVTNNPVIVNVTVDRTLVSYGTYSDVIQINSNGSNKQVSVIMIKQDPNAPALSVSPTQLNFGASLSTLNLNISNSGAGNLNWTLAKDQNWIQVNPSSGTNAGIVTVTVSRNGQPVGQNFTGNITITSNGGNKTIPVNMSTGLPYSGSWNTMTTNLAGVNSESNAILSVVNSSNIWVAGDKVWKYNGSVWTEQTKPSGIGKVYSISFSSANNGWAAGPDGIMKYNGSYWTKVVNGPSYGTYVITLDNNTVFIFTWYSVSKSFDGGQSWQTESYNGIGNDGMVRTADKSVSSNYLVAGFGGRDIISYDGLSWLQIYHNGFDVNSTEYQRYCVSVINSTNVWLTINGNSIKKYNGVSFKSELSISNLEYLNCISMISEVNGWAGGSKLYQYNGSGWVAKTASLGSQVIAIKMISENEGYAVTANGGILKYQ